MNVLLTAGNTFRCDDGVGPYIARRLKSGGRFSVMDAGQWPENIIDDLIALDPSYIMVVDAADFGGLCGEARLIPEGEIPETSLSTHAIPLSVVTGIVRASVKTGVAFIGIQVGNVGLGEGLSEDVKAAADVVINTLISYGVQPR